MRGNRGHPVQHTVGVQAGFPSSSLPFFRAAALSGDPLGRLWHLKECDASVCVWVCEGTCLYAAQIAGERAELPSHVAVQRLSPGARLTPNTTCQAK